MARIGQIIFNVQDYHSSGGYISTDSYNLAGTVSSDQPGYLNNRINIFDTNIVDRFDSKEFSKLGIQAPPGTKVILNETKNITIGRSGIYELDENIIITSIKFLRPKKYVLDQERTDVALTTGITGMWKAEQQRKADLLALDAKYPGNMTSEQEKQYWQEYVAIQEKYQEAYQEALSQFNMGLNGIYKLPNPDNIDAEENYQELYNVIIDFLY